MRFWPIKSETDAGSGKSSSLAVGAVGAAGRGELQEMIAASAIITAITRLGMVGRVLVIQICRRFDTTR